MSDIENTLEEHGQRRRKFLATSAKIAVTAPAVSLLIAKSSQAGLPSTSYPAVSGTCPQGGVLDGDRCVDSIIRPG